MTYTCKICSATSDEVEFYKGHTSRCKECHKARVRENRRENAEYYRAYDAKRFRDDPRVKARHKRYQKTESGIASMARSRKKWQGNNPEKRAAHVILGNAVRDGRLFKLYNCECCGAGGRIHGHHEDYAQPLNVVWCCSTCHGKIHRGEIEVELVNGKYTARSGECDVG